MSSEMRGKSKMSSEGNPADDVVQEPDLKRSNKPSTPTLTINKVEENDSDSKDQTIQFKSETAQTHTEKKRAVGDSDTTKARTDKKIKLESENQPKKGITSVDEVGPSTTSSTSTAVGDSDTTKARTDKKIKLESENQPKKEITSVDQVGPSTTSSTSTGARGGTTEDNKKSDFPRVLKEGDITWQCTLNKTDLENNMNKFYTMELLQNDESGNYTVQGRNGRVGSEGQSHILVENVQDVSKAKNTSEKRFTSKTGIKWDDRDHFEKVNKKYDLIDMDVDDGGPKEVGDQMSDTYGAPLGKLSRRQIEAGHEALIVVQNLVKQVNTSTDYEKLLESACSTYYTRIPHSFPGYQKPPIISSQSQVDEELKLFIIPAQTSTNE